MKSRILSSCVLSMLISLPLLSQEFAPSMRWFGDIRVRGEVDMRDFNQNTAANTYSLLRTRVGLEAHPVENVRVLVQVRDSRVFGEEKDATGSFNTLADSRSLDLHQGFVEFKKFPFNGTTLRAGRMQLQYGNERLIGPVGWHNVGRVFDGGLLSLDTEPLALDFFVLNLAEVETYVPVATPLAVSPVRDVGTHFFGAYGMLKNLDQMTLDGYVLYQWDRKQTVQGSQDLKRFTIGSYVKGAINSIDYEGEGALQVGSRQGVDVSAYMIAGTIGYSPRSSFVTRIAAGYEYLSGTSPTSTKYKTFDPLYGTNHKFYGFMDYFIAIPANTGGLGLVDLLGRATFSLADDVTANLWLHNFSYARNIIGESHLGQEVDLTASYRYGRGVSFEAGISTFLPDELMRLKFGGGDAAVWGYLSTQVSF